MCQDTQFVDCRCAIDITGLPLESVLKALWDLKSPFQNSDAAWNVTIVAQLIENITNTQEGDGHYINFLCGKALRLNFTSNTLAGCGTIFSRRTILKVIEKLKSEIGQSCIKE